jgi:hypothetical protein
VIDGVSRTGVYEELCMGRRIAGDRYPALNKRHPMLEGKRKTARVFKWLECFGAANVKPAKSRRFSVAP